MLQSWRQPAALFSHFSTIQFAGVMGMVLLAFPLPFVPIPSEFPKNLCADLAGVLDLCFHARCQPRRRCDGDRHPRRLSLFRNRLRPYRLAAEDQRSPERWKRGAGS